MSSHRKSIVDVVTERAESEAQAYAFLADGTPHSEQRWTFADTARQARVVAANLRAYGVGAGDRVVVAVNPGLDYIGVLYGVMYAGAVPVPCFPPLRARELQRFTAIAADCSPRAIVIDEMYRERMAGFPNVVWVETLGGCTDEIEPASVDSGDLALIQYTSGSTGSPKGVCLTHDNLVSNCEALDRSMGSQQDRVGFSWLPPYHDMGLMGTIILSMFHGWPLVLMSPMHFIQQPRRWLEAVTHYKVTVTVGPNFSLDLCADALRDDDCDDLDLSRVRQLYCGAEPISADTLARFERSTARCGFDARAVIPCYGMAEATLFVSGKAAGSRRREGRAAGAEDDRAVVSCGEVDSEHAVRVVDTATLRPVSDGTVGEIWVSGRSVAAGYYNRDDLTRNVFEAEIPGDGNRYLRTGDLGFQRGGELFVTGRIKDLIIICGRNIHPHDVEASVVRADPAFRAAAAFSVDRDGSERMIVVAEAKHEKMSAQMYTTMVETIRSSVTSEFGVGPDVQICPRRSIPTTTSGKVRRQEAKRRFLADTLQSVLIVPPAVPEYST